MSILNPAVPVFSKDELLERFKGKRVQEVQTPSLIVDRKIFIDNCKRMQTAVSQLGWDFRCHIKTHKTAEGTELQCRYTGTSRVCVSTLPEM